MRSGSFKVAFLSFILFLTKPEYTLKKVTNPFSLSFTTLKAKAHNLPLLEGYLISYFPLTAFFPIAWIFSGDGKYFKTASSKGCTPLFLRAEPHIKGTAFYDSTALRTAWSIASYDILSRSSSKYRSAKSSQ
jgi:hypothetical protein